MNVFFRLVASIILVAVYSFGISLGVGSAAVKAYSQTGNSTTETYWSAVSNNLSFYYSESEKLTADARTNFPASNKTSFTTLLAFIQTTGQVLEAGFAHYQRISETFLIRYRKADILFPFHYFW